mmetsp:Transcript_21238/g.71732  ORF Transcript_21238/g.71732 Transcript_21238/m.71732 type:complete len:279 (-) Transcript_21238:285-1121(-)
MVLFDITNGPRVSNRGKLAPSHPQAIPLGANHRAPGVAREHGPDFLGAFPPPSGMPEPLKPDPAQSPPAAKAPPPPMEKTIAPIQVSALEKADTAMRKLAKEPHVVALYARLKQVDVGVKLLTLCWQLVATKGVAGMMELNAVIHLGKSEGKKMKADAQQHERNMSPLWARAEEAKARGDTHEEARLVHELKAAFKIWHDKRVGYRKLATLLVAAKSAILGENKAIEIRNEHEVADRAAEKLLRAKVDDLKELHRLLKAAKAEGAMPWLAAAAAVQGA